MMKKLFTKFLMVQLGLLIASFLPACSGGSLRIDCKDGEFWERESKQCVRTDTITQNIGGNTCNPEGGGDNNSPPANECSEEIITARTEMASWIPDTAKVYGFARYDSQDVLWDVAPTGEFKEKINSFIDGLGKGMAAFGFMEKQGMHMAVYSTKEAPENEDEGDNWMKQLDAMIFYFPQIRDESVVFAAGQNLVVEGQEDDPLLVLNADVLEGGQYQKLIVQDEEIVQTVYVASHFIVVTLSPENVENIENVRLGRANSVNTLSRAQSIIRDCGSTIHVMAKTNWLKKAEDVDVAKLDELITKYAKGDVSVKKYFTADAQDVAIELALRGFRKDDTVRPENVLGYKFAELSGAFWDGENRETKLQVEISDKAIAYLMILFNLDDEDGAAPPPAP